MNHQIKSRMCVRLLGVRSKEPEMKQAWAKPMRGHMCQRWTNARRQGRKLTKCHQNQTDANHSLIQLTCTEYLLCARQYSNT